MATHTYRAAALKNTELPGKGYSRPSLVLSPSKKQYLADPNGCVCKEGISNWCFHLWFPFTPLQISSETKGNSLCTRVGISRLKSRLKQLPFAAPLVCLGLFYFILIFFSVLGPRMEPPISELAKHDPRSSRWIAPSPNEQKTDHPSVAFMERQLNLFPQDLRGDSAPRSAMGSSPYPPKSPALPTGSHRRARADVDLLWDVTSVLGATPCSAPHGHLASVLCSPGAAVRTWHHPVSGSREGGMVWGQRPVRSPSLLAGPNTSLNENANKLHKLTCAASIS